MKVQLLITALIGFILASNTTLSHPGRTAADGCHYCRTNCDKWGVPWNARHCHNGYNIEQLLGNHHLQSSHNEQQHSHGKQELKHDDADKLQSGKSAS